VAPAARRGQDAPAVPSLHLPRLAPPAVDGLRAALVRALGDSRVVTDRDVLEAHGGDESDQEPVLPDVVVRAESAEDVATTLRVAAELGAPVTPRAAGSGKSGGCVPVAGGIALATLGMSRILDLDRAEQTVTVEPGVILGELHRAVEAEGLFYAPDANSLAWCALGGNLAENAAGPRAMKYGPTRDWVLGMDVALMGGARTFVGRRTRKGVTGYDVTSLLVGSEGTLAVTTRAVLRLVPRPEHVTTMMALFADVHAAGSAVVAAVSSGAGLRCLELLDARTLGAVRARGVNVDPRAGAMLIAETDGTEASAFAAAEEVGARFVDAGALDVLVAQDEAQRGRLWEARRQLSPATRAMARHKISEDVVVPRTGLVTLLEEVDRIAEATGVSMLTYGHAGDGNLHVNFLWDDEDQAPRVHDGLDRLFRAVIGAGGTLTGEHGVGTSKTPWLALEQGELVVDLQRRLKAVFDPQGLLNPGKIFAAGGHRAC
jgi:glycolate oxidase